MKDLIITINANTRNALFTRNFIGVNGEYLDGYIKVDFQDEFIDGIATFEFERSDGKYYIEMTKGDDDYYYLQIKSSLLSKAEKLKCQIRVDQAGNEVFKCRRFPLYVLTAVNSATTIPEDYGDWLSHANQKLLEIDEAIDDAEEATTRADTISADLENKRDTDYYRGETGNGIASIVKTSTSGLVDTYTVTMTNGETATFTVTNGAKGDTGATGNGIQSITKTGTAGLVDTYTVLFTDGTSTTFTITNGAKGDKGETGNGILSIVKTSTSGLVDTYTITFTDTTTTIFTVTNGADGQTGATGNGIASISKTSTSGLVDTYTITFTDGTTTTFTVTNGADGTKIYINNVEQASLHFDSDPQNQINNKQDKFNYLELVTTTQISLTAGVVTNVGGMAGLTRKSYYGNKLSFNTSSREITIGAGVTKLKVYAKAQFYINSADTRARVETYINGVESSQNGANFGSEDIKTQYVRKLVQYMGIIDVAENDVITIKVSSSNSSSSNPDALQTNSVFIFEVVE